MSSLPKRGVLVVMVTSYGEGEAAIGGLARGRRAISVEGRGREGGEEEHGRPSSSSSSFVIGFENEIRADTTFARDIFHRFHAILSFFFSSFVVEGGGGGGA